MRTKCWTSRLCHHQDNEALTRQRRERRGGVGGRKKYDPGRLKWPRRKEGRRRPQNRQGGLVNEGDRRRRGHEKTGVGDIYTDSKRDMDPRSQIDSVGEKQPPPETVVKFTYGRGREGIFANSTIAAHCSAVMDDSESDRKDGWKSSPTFAPLSLSRQ